MVALLSPSRHSGDRVEEADIDVRTVAEWMGHRDHGALLLKTYSHVRPEHVREMVGRVRFGASP